MTLLHITTGITKVCQQQIYIYYKKNLFDCYIWVYGTHVVSPRRRNHIVSLFNMCMAFIKFRTKQMLCSPIVNTRKIQTLFTLIFFTFFFNPNPNVCSTHTLLHDITRCVLANYYSSFSSFSPFSSFTSWYILNLFFSSTATTYITGCSTIDFPVNISRNVFFPSFKS